MFEIYDSDTDEPQVDLSAFFAHRRYYSKQKKGKKIDSDEYEYDELNAFKQRSNWDDLSISIETAVNKLNPGNIRRTRTKLIQLNIIRGKGLLCRAIMDAQSRSTHCTHIYATLVSFINYDFPNVVELLLVRCICLLTDAYKSQEEHKYEPPVLFIAHLVQNNVVQGWLVLEILQVLIQTPNLHSIGLVDSIMKVCGKNLNSNPEYELSLKYMFDRLQNILLDKHIDESVQCLARTILLTYRNHFKDEQQFDLVDPDKQYTHSLSLYENYDPEYELDIFEYDLDFNYAEILYNDIAKNILKLKSKIYYFGDSDFDEMADDEDDETETETDMLSLSHNIAIQKTICMLVNLDLPASEIAHELMKIKLKPGQELKLCDEYLKCCFENSDEYNNFFSDIIQCLCQLNPLVVKSLELIFKRTLFCYPRRQTNHANMFAQLLASNTISWSIFSAVHLTDYITCYIGRGYLKAIFKELILLMGRDALIEHLLDPSFQSSFAGLFSFNSEDHLKFCVHFFSDIDLYEVMVPYI